MQEIGTTKFTQRQIESKVTHILNFDVAIEYYTHSCILDGATIYRKSLRDCTKPRSDAVVHKVRVRSRQQRVCNTFR